jgi:prefoldin subunit 5
VRLGLGALTALPAAIPGVRGLGEIVEALRVLPELNRRLAAIEQNTRQLPEIEAQIEDVARGTAVLREMVKHTEQIAETMPVLVELQASIPTIVPVLSSLNDLIEPLHASVLELQRSTRTLADVSEPLQGAAERFGRMADRLPRRRNER